MNARPVLVTGGSGFVGGAVIRKLVENGERVRAAVRSEHAKEIVLRLGAEPVPADLRDPESLRVAAAGCGSVLHAAAHFELWGDWKDFEAVNIHGTAALLRGARESGTVRRFVQIGAAAVIMGDPEPLTNADEHMPLQSRAWAPYSSSKARSEALVVAANQPEFATCVLRPPMIWGRGMPALDRMEATAKAGNFRWPNGGEHLISTCHVENVAHASLLALRSTAPGPFFITDGESRTLRAVVTELLATRGIDPPRGAAPHAVAWWMARAIEIAWRITRRAGEPPLSRQLLRLIGSPFTLDISRARRELGYEPVVDWAAGIGGMRSEGAVVFGSGQR